MTRPNRQQERINDVVEDALLFACDTEEFLTRLRATCDALLVSTREKKRSLSTKGSAAGFPHTRPELTEAV